MGEPDDQAVEGPIQGARLLRQVIDQFQSLKSVGTERDTADNRKLLYNHYAGLVLLSLFNPAMQCVQGLADASKLKKIQKLLGNQRVSVGSFSESVRVFDPQHLRTIFEQLMKGSTSAVDAGPRRKLPATIPISCLNAFVWWMAARCERCRRLSKRCRRMPEENGDCICSLSRCLVRLKISSFAPTKPAARTTSEWFWLFVLSPEK